MRAVTSFAFYKTCLDDESIVRDAMYHPQSSVLYSMTLADGRLP